MHVQALWGRVRTLQRLDTALRGNLAKFSLHPALHDFLLATGDQVLIEASPTDPLRRIGLAAEDPRAQDPMCWQGLNLPGLALMAVRDALGDRP